MATINKIPKCPPLRFPDFNDDWTQTTLGEIGVYIRGLTYTTDDIQESGYIVIRANNITEGKKINFDTELVQVSVAPSSIQVLQDNDIAISMANGSSRLVGKASYYNGYSYGTCTVGAFCGIFRSSNLLTRWLFQTPIYSRYIYESIQGGDGAIANLKGEDILRQTYSLPSPAEQKKIADFLSLIDERIHSLSETIKELKTQKAGLLNLLFSQKLRFPDFNDEWTQTTLGEATIIIMGQSPSSVNYNEEGIGLPLIQGNADMCSGTTIVRLYTSEITKEALKNDIIMSVRAPVGALAITPFRCCIGRGVCAIRADKYIYYYLQLCSKIWSKYSAGSTFDSITGENIRHLPLSLPSLAEQKKIADFLSLIDERIEVEEQLLKKYEEQKKYLLRHMFV